jgi:hypothetical protein
MGRSWRGPWLTGKPEPTRKQLLIARVYSVAQLPIGIVALWFVWHTADGTAGRLLASAFSAFTLLIVSTNMRDAWRRR